MPQQIDQMNYPAAYAPISQGISNIGHDVGALTQAVVDPIVAKHRNNQQTQIAYAQLKDSLGDHADEAGIDINSLAPQKDEPAQAYAQRIAPHVSAIVGRLTEKGVDPNHLQSLLLNNGGTYDQFKGYLDQFKVQQFKKEATATPQPVPGLPPIGDATAGMPTVKNSGVAEQEGYGNANQRFLSSVPTESAMEQSVTPIGSPEERRAKDMSGVSAFPQNLEAMQTAAMREAPPQAMDRPAPYAKGMQSTAESMNVEGMKPVQDIIGRQRNVESGIGYLDQPTQSAPEYLATQAAEGSDLSGAPKEISSAMIAQKRADVQNSSPELTDVQKELAEWAVKNNQPFSSVLGGLGFGSKNIDRLGLKNYMIQYGRSIGKEYNDVEAQAALTGARTSASQYAQTNPEIQTRKIGAQARGQTAKTINNQRAAAQRALSTFDDALNQYSGNYEQIPQWMYRDLASDYAKILQATGQIAEGSVDKVMQASLQGDLKRAWNYATGEQVTTAPSGVLKLMHDRIRALGTDLDKQYYNQVQGENLPITSDESTNPLAPIPVKPPAASGAIDKLKAKAAGGDPKAQSYLKSKGIAW
jgi:hypothetical protein